MRWSNPITAKSSGRKDSLKISFDVFLFQRSNEYIFLINVKNS
jgi:hypothetical protein